MSTKNNLDLFPVWNPLFDLSKAGKSELNREEVFKWCRFFYNRTIVGAVYSKMASYPISNLEIDHDDASAKDRYTDILLKKLKLKDKLIKIGKYYFTLSNAIVLVTRRVNKWIRCQNCGEEFQLARYGPQDGKSQYRYTEKNKVFLNGGCPECHSGRQFVMTDRPIKGSSGISIVIYKPENIEIVYNEVTAESEYYYKLSKDFVSQISTADHDILCTTPNIYLEAANKDKKIKLNKSNLFHFKMPDMDEYTNGWAVPEMVRAFYDLYTYLLMVYSDQQNAKRSMIPLDVLFPQSEQGTGAHIRTAGQYNFMKWRNKIKESYEEWKKDPTEPIIMPVPVGFQQLKGEGRRLLLIPEITEILKNILASLEVPIEFLFGGISWSRQNVAVVILENKLNSYISQLQELVDFVVDKVSKEVNLKSKPDVKIGVCKLVEDITLSQLMAQLVLQNRLSMHSLYNRLGLDYDKEVKYRKAEATTEADVLLENAKTQAHMQGILQKTVAKYEAYAQKETLPVQKEIAEAEMDVQIDGQKKMMDVQMEAQQQQLQAQGQQEQGVANEQQQREQQELQNLSTAWVSAKFQEDPETFQKFKQELLQESTDKYSIVQNFVNSNRVQLYGNAYINADSEALRGKIMSTIKLEDPNLSKLILEYIKKVEKTNEQAAVWALEIIRANPEQRNAHLAQLESANIPDDFREMIMTYINMFQSQTQNNPGAFEQLGEQEMRGQQRMQDVAIAQGAKAPTQSGDKI